jgi:hypothetical protein
MNLPKYFCPQPIIFALCNFPSIFSTLISHPTTQSCFWTHIFAVLMNKNKNFFLLLMKSKQKRKTTHLQFFGDSPMSLLIIFLENVRPTSSRANSPDSLLLPLIGSIFIHRPISGVASFVPPKHAHAHAPFPLLRLSSKNFCSSFLPLLSFRLNLRGLGG